MRTVLFVLLFGLISVLGFSDMTFQPKDSILTVREQAPGKVLKAGGNAGAYAVMIRSSGQSIESMQYRGFTILLNDLSDGTYEVQLFRIVIYGSHRVNSIFSSLYKSSIEFSYEYDSVNKMILRYHFVFPPNSLTGWADPEDYTMMQNLDWNEPFPSRKCYTDSPVHSLEESGREYMEATCLPDRDTAVRFATSFIDYMRSGRGL